MAATLMLAASSFGQDEKEGRGQAVVTIVPKHAGDSVGSVSAQDLKLKVNGKDTAVTSLTPLRGSQDALELVVLLDDSSRASLGNQGNEIASFIQSLPPTARVALVYMRFGRAVMAGPLTADHSQVVRQLHIPAGSPGSNGSPYFCISDLAKHWPGGDGAARREVLMVTDGVDEYDRRYDPDDPYVQASVNDAVRAGLVVYTIYFRGQGRADNTRYANDAGQNLMLQLTDATGGRSFWEGFGNPVSFQPYLDDLSRRLHNQYELSFVTRFSGKPAIEQMKLKLSTPGTQVDAPQEVLVGYAGIAEK